MKTVMNRKKVPKYLPSKKEFRTAKAWKGVEKKAKKILKLQSCLGMNKIRNERIRRKTSTVRTFNFSQKIIEMINRKREIQIIFFFMNRLSLILF